MEPVAVLLLALGGYLIFSGYRGTAPKATLQKALSGKPGAAATGSSSSAPKTAAPKTAPTSGSTTTTTTTTRVGPQIGETLPHLPTANVKELNADFASKLAAFIGAAAKAGHTITIVSGFRSSAHQSQLWDAALQKYGSTTIARKWVAPPGHSMHEKGLAADLSFAGLGLVNNANSTTNWAHSNAGTYGLTFPLGNEKWHIEPIGAR